MKSTTRVIMAGDVARAWIEKRARKEYRMEILDWEIIPNLPNLLRSFRDEKISISYRDEKGKEVKIPPIIDLGIVEDGPDLTVWTSSEDGIKSISRWLKSKNIETTGVW